MYVGVNAIGRNLSGNLLRGGGFGVLGNFFVNKLVIN